MTNTNDDIASLRRDNEVLRQKLQHAGIEQRKEALEAAGIGFYEWDVRHNHVTYSAAMKRSWGIQEEGTLDDALAHLHPEDRSRAAKSIQKSVDSGDPFTIEYRIIRPGGGVGVIRAHGTVSKDEAGVATHVFGTSLDITHERTTEEALVESRRLAQSSSQAILTERANFFHLFTQVDEFVCVLAGPEHRFEFVNGAHQRILGFDATGMTVFEAQPESIEVHDILDDVLHTGRTFKRRDFLVTINDGPRYFNLTYSARRDKHGAIDGVMVLGNDVTEMVEARTLQEQTVAALKSEREMREHFVATLTHDLRTPLAAAKMSTELILRKPGEPVAVQKRAARTLENIERASQMILDLLDANRLKAGEPIPLDIGPCDLRQICGETLAHLSTVHGDRFVLESAGDMGGFWSANGLRRVLENLCNNAVKYGAAFRPITVRLERTGDTAEIAVHNEGPPIPADELGALFAPYRRTNSARASGKLGWGLGLALVRGVSEAHGGSVHVESRSETGTTFRVRLPADARPQDDGDAAHSDRPFRPPYQ